MAVAHSVFNPDSWLLAFCSSDSVFNNFMVTSFFSCCNVTNFFSSFSAFFFTFFSMNSFSINHFCMLSFVVNSTATSLVSKSLHVDLSTTTSSKTVACFFSLSSLISFSSFSFTACDALRAAFSCTRVA